jgi:ribosome production factor 1
MVAQSQHFEASKIKNKIKREDVARKNKRAKNQEKLQRRLALAKEESNDPSARKVRIFGRNLVEQLLSMKLISSAYCIATPGAKCASYS